MSEKELRREAESDLAKPVLQLLEDAHEELLSSGRSSKDNFKHAFKRFASLQARAADAAERQARAIIILTVVLTILTVGLFLVELHKESLLPFWPPR